MTLKQIREEAWAIARETATTDSDRLWTQAEMNRYINRVYRQVARETKCIRDSVTPSVCRIVSAPPATEAALITLAATDAYAAQDLDWYGTSTSWLYNELVAPYSYPLSPLILDIDECKWSIRQWKLIKVTTSSWRANPWWEQVIGMPTQYSTDGDNNRLFVNFRSTESDTLKLAVRRLPLTDLTVDTDVPELRTHYQDFMINGILWQMYSKQDSQTFDGEKAVDYQLRFLKDIDEIKQQEAILDSRIRCNSSMDAFR